MCLGKNYDVAVDTFLGREKTALLFVLLAEIHYCTRTHPKCVFLQCAIAFVLADETVKIFFFLSGAKQRRKFSLTAHSGAHTHTPQTRTIKPRRPCVLTAFDR